MASLLQVGYPETSRGLHVDCGARTSRVTIDLETAPDYDVLVWRLTAPLILHHTLSRDPTRD